MTTYNAAILKQATQIISDLLPSSLEEAVKLHRIDLPKLRDDQSVFGPINGRKTFWDTYPDDWYGIAAGKEFSENMFWLIRKSEISGERTFFCLGAHKRFGDAINVAIENVYLELAFKYNAAAMPALAG